MTYSGKALRPKRQIMMSFSPEVRSNMCVVVTSRPKIKFGGSNILINDAFFLTTIFRGHLSSTNLLCRQVFTCGDKPAGQPEKMSV